jgi:predicted MFS family arabinose efflux permease
MDQKNPDFLTKGKALALAATTAVVTANAYYMHPIIGEIAREFSVGEGAVGIIPALNQLALALGIILLLPLGDRYSNRSLCFIFVGLQTISMLAMVFAKNILLFTTASTLLGFVTIAPYLIPAFASKRVNQQQLGRVTALLTAGVIFGILLARVGSGILAEAYGWRAVYWLATVLMITATITLPFTMQGEKKIPKTPGYTYAGLLLSLFSIANQNREVLLSATIQALNFGCFTATWLALALYLTSPELGYGVDTVGYLALIGTISVLSTPRIGKWADSVGPRQARIVLSILQLGGVLLLYPQGYNAVSIILPLALINLVGPSIDVTSKMTFLTMEPAIRTRLTTIYTAIMFVGGGCGSLLGTVTYDKYGWAGTCIILTTASATICLLSWIASKRMEYL